MPKTVQVKGGEELFQLFLKALEVYPDVMQMLKYSWAIDDFQAIPQLVSELRQSTEGKYYADVVFLIKAEDGVKQVINGAIEVLADGRIYVRLGNARFELDVKKIIEYAKYAED